MTTLAIGPMYQDLRPRAQNALTTPVGRLALVGGFTVVLAGLKTPFSWQTGLVLALTSAFPLRRKFILLLAALCWVAVVPPVDATFLATLVAPAGERATAWVKAWPVVVAAVWCFALAMMWAVRRFPKSHVGRHPVVTMLVVLCALMIAGGALSAGVAKVIFCASAMALGQYLWFFAYWLAENASARGDVVTPALRTYAWRPFWGFTGVPYGRGAAYLEKVEAKDDDQLLVSQIAGLKLLGLAVAWTVVLVVLKQFLFGPTGSLTQIPHSHEYGRVPTYQMALAAMNDGRPYPLHLRWLALASHFTLWALYFTVFGHKVIAILRMAGFNAFRNTYKPFLATSIAEFYNRIYYYFKELLVAFFFYPTYLRYFKKNPKVRLLAATLAAAGLGNFLFHFLRDDHRILRDGFFTTLWFYRTYAIYALLLGLAIGVSQLRVMARKGRHPTGWRKPLAIAGVIVFYCLLCIIEEPNDRHGLGDYGRFFVSLFRP